MKKYFLAGILASAFFVVGLFTLSDYGINWDAPYRMMRGQAYAHFFLTGRETYDLPNRTSPVLFTPGQYVTHYDFLAGEGEIEARLPSRPLLKEEFQKAQTLSGKRFSFYQHNAWNGSYFIPGEGPGHPPLPDIGGALFNRVFYQSLNIAGDTESYQIFFLLVSSIGVFIVTLFAYEITHSTSSGQAHSTLAAIVAGLSLALFPIFFAEAHLNMKDPLQAAFYTGSIWAFWHWVQDKKRRWFIGFTLFTTLALTVKWNIVFLPVILLPWLFSIRKTEQFKRWFRVKLLLYLSFFLLFAFLFFILIWPTTWSNPISFIFQVAHGYTSLGISSSVHIQPSGFILPLGLNIYPALLLFTQTPEMILMLGLIEVIGVIGIRGKRGLDGMKTGYLVLLWLCIPLVRTTLPFVTSYSGFRQIFEVIPAMAILAGIGAETLAQSYSAKFKAFNFELWFCFLIFALLAFPIVRLHPNQNLYFNHLVGGISGAKKLNLIDLMISYGNVYKQAAVWLNSHAEKDANIALLDGYSFALSPVWLRNDISISPNHFSGFDRRGEYILDLFNPDTRPIVAKGYVERFLRPIHSITLDGVTFLSIYKNDPAYLIPGYEKEKVMKPVDIQPVDSPEGEYIEVDLGKTVRVTRILVSPLTQSCIRHAHTILYDKVTFSSATYILHERKRLPNGMVEYLFPAERAKKIRITPLNVSSCFNGGIISSIAYLSE